jgi:dTDP-4-dehydrorhamnose 3,5-epimerase
VKIRELSVPGAFEVTPVQHADDRGVFLEWFKDGPFTEAVGHRLDLKQANISVSTRGTMRGIHFADVPPGQAKYVTCPAGAALDVVVDLRVGSPSFGRWDTVPLDGTGRRAVYVGEGLGHVFLALADGTVITYLCSEGYRPGSEHGVHPLDPAIGIAWPDTTRGGRPVAPLLSAKDAQAPTLAEAERAGLLPTYDAATGFVASLRA